MRTACNARRICRERPRLQPECSTSHAVVKSGRVNNSTSRTITHLTHGAIVRPFVGRTLLFTYFLLQRLLYVFDLLLALRQRTYEYTTVDETFLLDKRAENALPHDLKTTRLSKAHVFGELPE